VSKVHPPFLPDAVKSSPPSQIGNASAGNLLLRGSGWGGFQGHTLLFQLLHIFFRVFLELGVATGAAEIDAFAFIIGIDLFINIASQYRAFRLGTGLGGRFGLGGGLGGSDPETASGKGGEGQSTLKFFTILSLNGAAPSRHG
jgi:hypothetical protein